MPKSDIENSRWLVVAHCFNMDGRAASHTITDRMPYLLEKGITPVVLSAPTGVKDKRFPHFRALSPAPSGLLFELRQIIKNKINNIFKEKLLKAILTILCLPFYIVEKIFFHLDSQWSWFISATARGYYIIKKYRPKLIYTAAGPSSTHAAGFFLNKFFDIPWIAELYDPLLYDNDSGKSQRFRFQRWIERIIFKNADAVIYFTEKAMNSAKGRHPERDNVYMLRPGAPPEDYSEVSYAKTDKIHFGHFGVLGKGRDLTVFIKALYELINEASALSDKISLDIYGTELDQNSRRSLLYYPLNGIIREYGRLEYDPLTGKSGRRQVLEAMRKCDVLLVIHGTDIICEEYIPSKVYEYLLTSRPILGLGLPGSELGALLSKNGHTFVNGEKVGEVKTAIRSFLEQWEASGLPDQKSESIFTVNEYVNSLLKVAEKIV